MNSFDLDELFDTWEDLNLTGLLENGTRVEMSGCPTAFDRSALLHSMCILYVFIFVVGLAANSLVLWINIRAQRTTSPRYETHLYIAHLAAADLCVCITLPVWVSSLAQHSHWPFSELACKLTHLLFSVNLFSSIFFLACMSVDRYLSLTRPADSEDGGRRRKLIRHGVCMGVWLLALVASLPDTYFLRALRSSQGEIVLCRPVYPEEHPREWMVGVQLSFILLGFIIPFPVIALAYALLAKALSSSSSSSSAVEQERCLSRRVILAYIVVFLGCWGPYHGVLLADALSLLGLVPLSCGLENALYVALHLTQCLSLLHCCVNPILYNFLNRNYRYDLMKAFIFKYSTRTGLARLIEQTHVSETEYSAVAVENTPQI
ncbi:atypical chemokine receptor 3-like [Oncorhynchus tshawytscha]|uniref:G-protein coupled receptors family 1 profile domain-containing protein n=1 Tax=Oncorhynchus tshawytscha TaxID=74940 RepID=A0AAZ3SCL5_ONCTS|nr:atypical chemokine receptor 3-like [Oncorhynchus tshawytscha]XP_024264895.1 atypical chemokine receptor 3-like [Oncorhynchus tshawytscha]